MTELIVGIKHIRDGIESQIVIGAEMSVIGIIGTAPAADAAAFPLNTAVYLKTNEAAKRVLLGTTGTLPQALEAISAQLAGSAHAAKTVLVRVTEGVDPIATIASMVGVEADGTGIWAFLQAPTELGVTPRLVIAPGFTSQSQNGVDAINVSAGGTGYTSAPAVVIEAPPVGGVQAVATAVLTAQVVTSVVVSNPGSGYLVAPGITFTGGAGTGATATASLEQLANAVVAAIPTVLERLRAGFIPEGPTSTHQAYLDWLETVPASQRIFHPLRQDAKVFDVDGETVLTRPLSPYIAALYVRRDSERDGVPSGSAANQTVYGIVGVTPTIPFSLTDETSEGQEDLEIHAGIVVKGDIGVEGSLSDTGYVFWGTDTLSAASEWLFTHVNRTRDYSELGQVRATRYFLGRFNISLQVVQAIINTMEAHLSILRAEGHILDYRVSFEPDLNTPLELRLGHLDVTFQAEEPPVLRKITIRSRRYALALTNLVRQISVALGNTETL